MSTATATASAERSTNPLIESIRRYWDEHIHDLAIVKHPVGTLGFFDDLANYRFEKLDYLPRLVDFTAYRGKNILEIGCGAGIDAVRFAQNGAHITGVDLSNQSISLARKNFELRGLEGHFDVMNGEKLEFPDNSFDVVYAHGVLQYTASATRMVAEIKRVLKPGGVGIMMVYNRISWLNLLSHIMSVGLEHQDAPVLKKYSIDEFKAMLSIFPKTRIVVERFPVRSRLHGGLKGLLYNTFFVGAFNAIPRRWVERFGWHIMAFVQK